MDFSVESTDLLDNHPLNSLDGLQDSHLAGISKEAVSQFTPTLASRIALSTASDFLEPFNFSENQVLTSDGFRLIPATERITQGSLQPDALTGQIGEQHWVGNDPGTFLTDSQTGTNSASENLVFVDSQIQNYQSLIINIKEAQVFILDANRDGIEQITEILAQQSQVSSLQILSHAQSGNIQLGTSHLSNHNLPGYAPDLKRWAAALKPDADILLYGCNLAAGEAGVTFVQQLSQLTDADVAASTDLTGNAALGGNWTLEVATGKIEAVPVLQPEVLQNYSDVLLTTINYSNFADSSNLKLNGNAATPDNRLRLTPDLKNQKGSAFVQTPIIIDGGTSFHNYFQFQIQGTQGTSGGDGFAFVVQNSSAASNALGQLGGFLGYGGITQSIAVEFDTYKGTGDLNNNHISVLQNGDTSNALAVGTPTLNLNSGSLLHAWIDYDGTTDQLSVFLANSNSKPSTAVVSQTLNLVSLVGSQAFIGFSAGTGGKINSHDILLWQFASDETTAPTASATASDLTEADTNPYSFSVTYSDNLAVDVGTIDSQDILVTSSTGVSQLATLVSVDSASNGSPRTAIYSLTAPGGSWDASDNGTYSLTLLAGQVADINGNFSGNTSLGSFQVNIPDPSVSILALSASSFTVNEASQVATLTVTRSGNLEGEVSVNYTTGDGTATAGADYLASSGTLIFASGQSSRIIEIEILDDSLSEGNKTFSVALDRVEGAILGTRRTATVILIDDETPPSLIFSQPTFSVGENEGTVTITVTRTGDVSSGTVTVGYATSNDIAVAGTDYTSASGTLTFHPGELTKSFTIGILDDVSPESNEAFTVTLNNPMGIPLGAQSTAAVTIVDDDSFIREIVVSGLTEPTDLAWIPDGSRMLIAQKNGIVRVFENGTLLSAPFIDISAQVNSAGDRGLLGITVHPDFPNQPYVYLLFTYDPPEVFNPENQGTLAGRDKLGNRPSRLLRVTANASTNYRTALPGSEVILLGTNSVWEYTSRPDVNSTGNLTVPPSGINNGTTIIAPPEIIEDAEGNIRDYLATDSSTHSIGSVRFALEGSQWVLFVSNGDGTSYGSRDPRTVRVQDLDNLSGKILRIDPLTGAGLPDNPFYNGDPNSNRAKVYDYGLRNPFRFTINPNTNQPVIGDVGWYSWEEINTGRGVNFGWPYYEGGNGVSLQQSSYNNLPEAQAFYASGQPVTPAIYARQHNPEVSALIVGDFYTGTTFPDIYQGSLFFNDVNYGTVDVLRFNSGGQVISVEHFATGIPYIVRMATGLDSNLYYVNLGTGEIGRWRYVPV